MKKFILITFLFLLIILTGCSKQEISNSIEQDINNKVQLAKEEIGKKIDESVKNEINKGMDSVGKSIEGALDPKLGEIRKNMENIKEAVLVYYKINKKMPIKSKVEGFFDKSFENMKIDYKLSADETRAFILYVGKDYTKEKVPDMLVDPNLKQ